MHFTYLDNPFTLFLMKIFQARIVGGAVRDALLANITPKPLVTHLYDLDLATPLTPTQMIKVAKEHNLTCIPTGLAHGTVTIVPFAEQMHPRIEHYEITTLRKDVQTDGRHAKVEFVHNWEEDAKRRDFTINAMYLDDQGNVYDYFNGQDDLKNKIVRFIGDPVERIKEDYLRIMRFFRFQAYYGEQIDGASMKACSQMTHGLKMISKERIWKELFKLASAPNPLPTLQLMQKLNILTQIDYPTPAHLEELTALRGKLEQSFHPLMLIALFTGDWKGCKLSNHELQFVQNLRTIKLTHKADWLKALYKLKEEWVDAKIIYDAVVYGANIDQIKNWLKDFKKQVVLPVSGRDLMQIGCVSGESMGKMLKQLEQLWFESDMNLSQKELLQHASNMDQV